MSLIDLPQTKWGSGTGRQVILKGDFAKISRWYEPFNRLFDLWTSVPIA